MGRTRPIMGSLRNCEPWSAQKQSTTTSEQLGLLVNILTGKYCDPKTATTITLLIESRTENPFLLFGLFVAAVYILLPDNFPVQTLFILRSPDLSGSSCLSLTPTQKEGRVNQI